MLYASRKQDKVGSLSRYHIPDETYIANLSSGRDKPRGRAYLESESGTSVVLPSVHFLGLHLEAESAIVGVW
jgi:hypothetical protein